jgi:ornithine carbamoyltransferase
MLSLSTSHFLTGEELSRAELHQLLETAIWLKKNRNQEPSDTLKGKTLALIFEKPSLRTRVSFTVGIQELGGNVIELTSDHKKNEDPEDTIRVLQGMVHGVMLRTHQHEILERMTTKAKIPVINGLSDLHHPCQAIADLQTLLEKFGQLKDLTLTYIGDGNNVLHSLLLLLPYLGVNLNYSCPEGFEPSQEILLRAKHRALETDARIQNFSTASEAARGAQAIYTDVWTSMGFENSDKWESEKRLKSFKNYKLNSELYSMAAPGAIIMHCLPMVRGQEITSEMAEHTNSALFDQAENRLHAQKALLMGLFSERKF